MSVSVVDGSVSASKLNINLPESKTFLETVPDNKLVELSTSLEIFNCNVLPVVKGMSSILIDVLLKLPPLPCGDSTSSKSFQLALVVPSLYNVASVPTIST